MSHATCFFMTGASQARRLFARHFRSRWLTRSPGPKRFQSSKATPKAKAQHDDGANPFYPERLLIFDAGVGRTFLVASVRVTTLLACLGSLYAVVLPKALKVQDLKDGLAVAKAAVLSTIPPFVTHIFTHSYVATITLILPRSARSSATALQRFVSRPAPDTVLHIQTVKPWGTWQNNVVSLLSLREAKHRWTRLENFTTIHGRRSIIGTGQKFYVGDAEKGQTRSRMPGVWTSLARLIKRNSEMESMSTS